MRRIRPVQQKQCPQCHPVAEKQRSDEVQHGEELHQPGHGQNGAPPPHAVTQDGTNVQHLNTLWRENMFIFPEIHSNRKQNVNI